MGGFGTGGMGLPPPWDVREYGSIDSTNLEARRLLDAGAAPGLVVTARHQTGGMGRMGRGWLDLPGKSLVVSLVLQVEGGFVPSMLVALSARAAIVAAGGVGPRFKWPNDLVYGKRKVGGILAEAYGARDPLLAPRGADAAELVIVGLGLNVGYLPGELEIPAKLPPTSLLIEEGRTWEIGEILRVLLRELEARWDRGRGELMEEYRENMAFAGKTVRVEPPLALLGEPGKTAGPIEGLLRGIDDEGNLLLELEGRSVRVVSGDLHCP